MAIGIEEFSNENIGSANRAKDVHLKDGKTTWLGLWGSVYGI